MIYLDNNATTRVAPEVVEAMGSYWSNLYFNPSSVAGEVMGANRPIQDAKEALSSLLSASPEEFRLTSGATEANNWALQSVVRRSLRLQGGCHLIVSLIEHPSVLETAKALARDNNGVRLDLVPVNNAGVILLEELEKHLTNETAIVSVMCANNETGVIQPLGEALRLVKAKCRHCLFHTDATQAVGKIPIDLEKELAAVDLLSLSAHKFHGPKGIGALFIRRGVELEPLLNGGSQQDGMRAGTENPPLAAGLAKALELLGGDKSLLERERKTAALRDTLEEQIRLRSLGIDFLGEASPRLPNTSLLMLPGIDGEMAVHQLLESGIVASTGSACSTGSDVPSYVLTAMGVSYSKARNVLRLSLSPMTTREELEKVVAALVEIIAASGEPANEKGLQCCF